VQRQEGKPVTTSHRGFVRGSNPCRENPRSATHLKMVGRRREEQVAERLRKPVSGTVVGGVGPAGGTWATRTWTLSPDALKGTETPGEVPHVERHEAGTFGTYREGALNPTRGSPTESHPWARLMTGTPEGSSGLRLLRPNRERVTQTARYIVDWQYSEGGQ